MNVTFTFQASTLVDVENGTHQGINAFFHDSISLGKPGPLPSVLEDKKAFERFGIKNLDIDVVEAEGYNEFDNTLRYNVTVRMEMGR